MSQHISEKFPLHIIAIGASAGGLEALQEFLAHLPDLDDSCILIAQHLSPTHKSMLVQLLSRQTTLRVSEAIHGHNLSAKTVYITPPDKEIYVQGDQIFLRKPSQSVGPKPSVDVLFNSLAHQENRLVLGIILSGTGSDGAAGVMSLKNSGGVILVQDPNTAKYDGMPQSAIQTGMVDLILPPEKMGQEIEYIFQNSGKIRPNEEDSESDKGLVLEADAMARIFSLMGKRTGTDFSNYKSATISRRLEKRLNHLNIPTIEEYLKYIEKEPREIDEMFATILIGVTKFFRDEEAFSSLKESLIQLVDGLADENPYLRIWVAGCSTGEEAYTIAIIIFQILQEKKMRVNVQIFATDIDDKAIAFARRGIYSSSSLSHLPDSIQDQFFIKRGKDYELVKTIRSMVLFSKHDLIKNPPFLKLDLISCRNLLIYFNSILQEHVFPIFHYALKKDAILLLGKSETIGKFTDLFTTYDAKNKIFLRKRAGNIHPVKFSSLSQTRRLVSDNTKSTENILMKHTIPEMVKETFYNTFEYPYVVIDDEYNIQEVNGDVRLFLSLVPGAIQVNILKMVNPELQIEVRSLLARVIRERLSLKSNIKKFELFGNMHYVRISAKPLLYSNSIRELFVVVFEKLEISEFINKGNFTDEDSIVNARILELEHELTSTKEHLQTY
ncbi:MAG: hypothetical protein JJT78_09595, partial [Leptospira sp.]|nr:hypothetical protein [Leptospira sp.]